MRNKKIVREWFTKEQHRYSLCSGILTASNVHRRRTVHAGIGGRVGYEVSVQPEEGKGLGIQARIHFARGAIVTQYEGFIIDRKEADQMLEKATHVYSCGKIVIDGLKDRTEAKGFGGGSFVNHSETPNTIYTRDSLGRVFLKALQPIKPGEFISVKYGSNYIRNKRLFQPSE